MKYAAGADFRRALETRLRALNQRDGAPLARLRKLIAFDRLLARLLYTEPEAWVLKGGLALQLRLGQRARTTKDMDVMWRLSAADLHQLLTNAASLDINDWFRFVVERTQAEEELLPGGGKRFYVRALLDSRPFESFHVDVGIGDRVGQAGLYVGASRQPEPGGFRGAGCVRARGRGGRWRQYASRRNCVRFTQLRRSERGRRPGLEASWPLESQAAFSLTRIPATRRSRVAVAFASST